MSKEIISQTNDEIRESVRKQYAEVVSRDEGCCGPACCGGSDGSGESFSMIGDAYDGVDGYVADADFGLGCGLPVEHAGICVGDTVLDLGSGAGLDAFIARRIVGETGQVIGVDMTAEMVAKGRENAEKQSYENVDFRLGEIEHMPVDADSVDVAVSNCVLNLVPDKKQAFAEIYRVLKPGAHFCISDIVASQVLPEWTAQVAALYAGCVTGAMPKREYLDLIADAGFGNVEIKQSRRIDIPEDVVAKFASTAQIADAQTKDLHVLSLTVTGVKPDLS